MGVANLIEQANAPTVNRVLSRKAAPEFKKTPVMMAHMHIEDMPRGQGTMTKGFVSTGSMTAAALAQSTALAVGANGERTDVVTDATCAKACVVSGVTVENQEFGSISMSSYAESAGRAIGRFVDNQLLALFSSITSQVIATGTDEALTIEDLDEAQLAIFESECPDISVPLTFVGAAKALRDLKADIRSSGGPAYSSDKFLSIFDGPPQANGYFGSLPGYSLFMTAAGIGTSTTRNVQALFHPMYAFAGMFDSEVKVWRSKKGSEGFYEELACYYFWAGILWNDGAACEILSAS